MFYSNFLKTIAFLVGVLAMVFLVNFIVLAWTEPGQAPPGCPSGSPGCDAPINVGTTDQTKTGGLGVKFLSVSSADNDKIKLSGTQTDPHTIWLGDSKGVRFWDNANGELMRITNTGSVGIGTASPQSKLEVKDQIRISRSTDDYGFVLKTASDGADLRIGYMTAVDTWYPSAPIMTLKVDTGNVGIGTTDPKGRLGFNSDGSAIVWGAGPYSKIYDNGDLHIWTDDSLFFDTNKGEKRLYIDSNGDVSVAGSLTVGGNLNLGDNNRCTIRGEIGAMSSSETVTDTESCSSGEIMTGGGCECGEDQQPREAVIRKSYPSDKNTWSCTCQRWTGSGSIKAQAWVVCCF